MDTQTLFIHPDTLIGRTIAYHPFLDILAAGGYCDSDGALVFFHSKTDIRGQPFQHYNIQANTDALNLPTSLVLRTPSYPETVLPLNSVLQIAFSPCGRFLAVLGSDSESEKVFVYRFAPLQIKRRKLTIFKRFDSALQYCDIMWSPDSSFIVAGALTGEITLFPVRTKMANYNIDYDSVRTCNKQTTIKALSGPVLGMTWSRCGFLLAVQGYNAVQIIVCKVCKNSVVLRKGQQIQWFRPELYLQNGLRFDAALTDPSKCRKYAGNCMPKVEEYFDALFLEKGGEKHTSKNVSLRTIYAVATYRRQPAFSPDSSFLVLPSAVLTYKSSNGAYEAEAFCTLVYTKTAQCYGHQDPSIVLPGLRYPSTAVAFSPCMYELTEGKPSVTDLEYQMLFAVAAGCDVYVYSTQDFRPVFEFSGESFQADYVTFLSWSADGRELCAFGAHFQYQYFMLPQFRLFRADFSAEMAYMAQDTRAAVLKADYAARYLNYRKKLASATKKPTVPVKPRALQIDFSDVKFQRSFKVFAVTDYLTTDIQSQPLVHFDDRELEELVELVAEDGLKALKAKAGEKPDQQRRRRYKDGESEGEENAEEAGDALKTEADGADDADEDGATNKSQEDLELLQSSAEAKHSDDGVPRLPLKE